LCVWKNNAGYDYYNSIINKNNNKKETNNTNK
jgi:hypothetical protein